VAHSGAPSSLMNNNCVKFVAKSDRELLPDKQGTRRHGKPRVARGFHDQLPNAFRTAITIAANTVVMPRNSVRTCI
jgi:hypothetical protein